MHLPCVPRVVFTTVSLSTTVTLSSCVRRCMPMMNCVNPSSSKAEVCGGWVGVAH